MSHEPVESQSQAVKRRRADTIREYEEMADGIERSRRAEEIRRLAGHADYRRRVEARESRRLQIEHDRRVADLAAGRIGGGRLNPRLDEDDLPSIGPNEWRPISDRTREDGL